MDRRSSGALFRWALRSHRLGVLLIGAGLGFVVLVLAPSYLAAAKAVAGGLTTLAKQAQGVAQSFSVLTGPVERLDTIGGYLSYKIFPDIALLVALYAAIQGSQVVRGSETRGLIDLWCATGVTRAAILRIRAAAFLASLAVITVAVYVGTVAGGALAHAHLVGSAVPQCAAIFLTGAFSFGLGLLVSQFTLSARVAAGVCAGYLVASFFVANLSAGLGALTFLRYLTPFHYYIDNRTLVPGVGANIPALIVLSIAAVITMCTAAVLFLRRDLDGVALQGLLRTRPPTYTFRPSRVRRRTLWLAWLGEQWVSLATWMASLFALAAVEAAVVPAAIKLVNSGGGSIGRALAQRGVALTPREYLSFFLALSALLTGAFGVTQVARWASDTTQHRTDALLVQPVSMGRLLLQRGLVLMLGGCAVAASTALGVWLGAAIAGYAADAAGLVRAAVMAVLLCCAVGGLGLVAVTAMRSAAATVAVSAVLGGFFFLTVLAGALSWPGWTANISVFGAYGSPYLGWPGAGSIAYLTGLAMIGLVCSYLLMRSGLRVAA